MFALFNLYIKGVWCHSSAEEIKLLKAGVSLFIRLRGINGTFLLRGARMSFTFADIGQLGGYVFGATLSLHKLLIA